MESVRELPKDWRTGLQKQTFDLHVEICSEAF
jgi:hypothetical protein